MQTESTFSPLLSQEQREALERIRADFTRFRAAAPLPPTLLNKSLPQNADVTDYSADVKVVSPDIHDTPDG